jgi:hypothetical protein
MKGLGLPGLPSAGAGHRLRIRSSSGKHEATEHEEQSAVISWFGLQYPALAGCLFAIPNGSHLAGNARQRGMKMAWLKAEGFLPGASDLFLMVIRQPYAGLFIEMKRRSFTPSDVSCDQRKFIKRAREQGYRAEVCGGFDAARQAIQEYLDSCVSSTVISSSDNGLSG